MATRTLIADDHRTVRDGVRSILAADRDFDIVGEAEDGLQALALARSLRPDLIVLDNSMPGMTGIDVAKLVVAELPDTAIVMLTLDGDLQARALAAGAMAHVAKDDAPSELLRAPGSSVKKSAPEGVAWRRSALSAQNAVKIKCFKFIPRKRTCAC